jgi:hypothetical protein
VQNLRKEENLEAERRAAGLDADVPARHLRVGLVGRVLRPVCKSPFGLPLGRKAADKEWHFL